MVLLSIVVWMTFLFLLFQVLYLFVLSIAGNVKSRNYPEAQVNDRRFLLILPSYREDNVIIDSVDAALQTNYPEELRSILVIADGLQKSTVGDLRNKTGVEVIEVFFEKSTKSKSIKTALDQLAAQQRVFDVALILDADNIILSDCLRKVNAALDAGYQIVQLHRTAKNKNTAVALLDAISEEMNNHLFRKGVRNLGLSSALIGSGMAFPYTYLQQVFQTPGIEDNPGEDKEIEHILLRDGLICEYVENGYVLDEKVQSTMVLEKQRTRWISAQLMYVKRYFFDDISSLFTTNRQYFFKAIQYLVGPRILLLAIVNAFAAVFIVLHWAGWTSMPIPWYYWLLLACVYNFTLLMAIPGKYYDGNLLKALKTIPGSVFAMTKAMLRSKMGQRDFIHTVKTFKEK